MSKFANKNIISLLKFLFLAIHGWFFHLLLLCLLTMFKAQDPDDEGEIFWGDDEIDEFEEDEFEEDEYLDDDEYYDEEDEEEERLWSEDDESYYDDNRFIDDEDDYRQDENKQLMM